MKYAASSECSNDVGDFVGLVHRAVDPLVAELLSASKLAEIDGQVIYVPIVMPVEMHERYKERSRYVARRRTYECCPHLNHAVFAEGDLKATFEEYLRGLATAAQHLHRLNASEDQVAEFLSILDHAGKIALVERRDLPRQ